MQETLSTDPAAGAAIYPDSGLTRYPPDRLRQSLRKSGRLRRSTLVTLRWVAIAGQLLALLIVREGLGYNLPLALCGVAIGASVLVNLLVSFALPLDRRVSGTEAVLQLGFDLLQLGALLWLTGV